MRPTKMILLVLFLLIASSFIFSDTSVYMLGKGNFFSSSGSDEDYKEGENDFPLTSSHQSFGFGIGFLNDSGRVFFGFEAQYNSASTATLTDPSDDDMVEIDTYPYAAGLLLIGFNVVKTEKFNFFFNGGGGIGFISGAETKTYTSRKGFDTEIDPPEKKISFIAFGGMGMIVRFSPSLGLMVNARYQHIGYETSVSDIEILAAFTFAF